MVHQEARETVVELGDVSRWYGDTAAVRDLSLELKRGEFFSLLGPSGCGKTTTLRMIAGFDRPDSGSLRIMGRDVRHDPPNRRPVNTVFQNYALFSHLDVRGNIEFGLREAGVPRAQRGKAVEEALGLVRLSGYEERRTVELSGGEQQRVALARAIVNRPKVLLLDEPLGALDLKLRRAMQEELKALQQRLGITFLYVTHDQEEALLMSDRVGVMRKARLEQVGTPEQLYDRPASAFVADFVGEANILPAVASGASSGGVVGLMLVNGQTVEATTAAPVIAGASGALILRPESVRLVFDDAAVPGGARLTGTVESTYFVGTFRRFAVDLGAGQRIIVVVTNQGPAAAEPGARVVLEIGAVKAWFLPGEAVLGPSRSTPKSEPT